MLRKSGLNIALWCGALSLFFHGPGALAAEESPSPPYEVGIIPAVAYDSSTGTGFGLISNIANFVEGFQPYRWRLTGQAYMTFKEGPGGEYEFPVQHHYFKLDVPKLYSSKLRARALGRYRRRSNAGFFGVGNQSTVLDTSEQLDTVTAFRFNQYDVQYAELGFELRYRLADHYHAFGGLKSWWAEVVPYAGSYLERTYQEQELNGVNTHGVGRLSLGLLYDSRDNETTPTDGVLHEVSFRGGKNIGIVGGYGGFNATGRVYFALHKKYAVIASRVMFDALLGDVPVYLLARHGGLDEGLALGDGHSIRGIPNGRYHGKIKLFGNVELRSKLFDYRLFGTSNNIGVLVFADGGRLWAGWKADPNLDGESLGLKYGVGAGLRLQFGRTFIVRTDTSWSPDGRGTYVNINHIF